tara:strand:+ start:201 stop:824 length:624 start_codon:yes stop_codon:yes gene_type:complete
VKQIIEFIPIALFVGVYFATDDVFLATIVLMAGICVQVGYEYGMTKEVSKQTQVIFWVAIVLGGATIFFRNEQFLFWKPTVVNWLFCLVLVVTHFFSRENLLKRILGSQLTLPDHVWVTLSFGWAVAFFIQGTLNLIVAYNFSLDFWVTYKLVGGIGLTLIYIIITMTYLVRGGYLNDDDTATQSDTVAPDSETAENTTHKPKPGTE